MFVARAQKGLWTMDHQGVKGFCIDRLGCMPIVANTTFIFYLHLNVPRPAVTVVTVVTVVTL